ncbi:hypothetical protein CORC01_01476 [Colletotrichum orchidophilum]|uniref:Uncharacterized protein n=1 Tax=Colletotrichum orchidophilum TaxID=1209926 RepID=A0A1G4BNR9_9PEZI|nr:uncharacterized protein CORC01_01476 [Colletotrichum orchidophilum]OHF03092.1 hypothetical protein CORC01_01476 [Colletotrichum orchidophilum]
MVAPAVSSAVPYVPPNICCSSFAGHTCTKDQYDYHRQDVILNQIINVFGKECVRKGAGPGAWTPNKNWSEWYACEVWTGPEQRQIEVGECTLYCGTSDDFKDGPCV